jgi:hypothetical protein
MNLNLRKSQVNVPRNQFLFLVLELKLKSVEKSQTVLSIHT